MNLEELKAKYSELYAALKLKFQEEGIAKERDRVLSHLVLGNASGDMKTAMQAVEDGSELTGKLQAQYLAAGMNKKSVETREEENVNTDGLPVTTPDASSLEKQTSAAWDEMYGAEEKGGVVS